MTVLDLLSDAADGEARIRFLADHDERSIAELWSRSIDASDWLSARLPAGGAVAAVLTPSFDCLATIVGAWRSGLELVSLPQPGRGMPIPDYQSQVDAICQLTGARYLMVDARYMSLIPPMTLEVVAFDAAVQGGPPGRREALGSFVQFTSGSTSDPKGVRLTLDSIGANVLSLLEVVEPRPDDVVVSWLPLSHDMGLIGTLLTPLAGGARRWAGSGTLCLMFPEDFISRPGSWMEACSEHGATFTAAPNFALELAARLLARRDDLDLSRLRTLVTGAETIRATTLRKLAAAGSVHGFDERAFCPAYGLAEATLAVTVVRPDQIWRAEAVDPEALHDGRWLLQPEHGHEVVATGSPVPGTELRIASEHGEDVGEVLVKSASLLSEYVGAPDDPLEDGWLRTGDLGTIRAGELFLTARIDDMIVVGGRNIFATELEAAIDVHAGVRKGNCVAVPDDAGGYVVVAEPVSTDRSDLRTTALDVRSLLARHFMAPSAVQFVARGSLPKTPSGKAQRHKVAHALRTGSLPVEQAFEFRPTAREAPE